MTKMINWCDRVMFGALLVLVIFVPYSPAMIQAGLVIMMLGWIIKRSLNWRLAPKTGPAVHYGLVRLPIQWPLILIFLLILLTLPWSHAPALTLKKVFSRFVQNALLLYLVVEIINTPKRFFILMTALLSTLAVVNADVFIQYFRGESFIFGIKLLYGRVSGPMRHPNDLGTLLVTVLPLVIALFFGRKEWFPIIFKRRWTGVLTAVLAVIMFLLVIALGLSSSRGAWLAFAVTITGFAVFLRKPAIILGIMIVLGAFFWGFGVYCANVRTDIAVSVPAHEMVGDPSLEDQDSFKEKVNKGERFWFNSSRRYEYWQTAFKVIEKFPVFGCGYNTYIQALKKHELIPQEYPHNSLIQITAELGLIGLLLHGWLFFGVFICARRVLDETSKYPWMYMIAVGLSMGILAWFIHSLTDTAWVSLQPSILWWLFIGILISLGGIVKQLNISRR